MKQLDLKPLLKRRRNPFLYTPRTVSTAQNGVSGLMSAITLVSINQFLPMKYAFPIRTGSIVVSMLLGGKVGAGFGGAATYSLASDIMRMLNNRLTK